MWINVRLRIRGFFGKTRTIVNRGPCRPNFTHTARLGLLALMAAGGCLRTAQAAEDQPPDAGTLLAQSVATLKRGPALEMKLRHTTRWFEQELAGSGTYLQSQSPRGLLLRLELRLSVGDQQSSLQQVCDGRFLWIRRELPGGASLGRVDMDRMRQALGSEDHPYWAGATASSLAVGGLPQLLTALAENFQFSMPRTVQSDDTLLWAFAGRWKPERLATLLPDQQERILAGATPDLARLPGQLPTEVRIVLRQSDLLPSRIEYRRTLGDRDKSAGKTRGPPPMVVLEILEIQRHETLDENLFCYQPGNQEVADFTELYLESLAAP